MLPAAFLSKHYVLSILRGKDFEMIQKRYYTAREISIYMGLNEETVRKWAQRGSMPFCKFGKSLRFDMRKVEIWIKKNEVNITNI